MRNISCCLFSYACLSFPVFKLANIFIWYIELLWVISAWKLSTILSVTKENCCHHRKRNNKTSALRYGGLSPQLFSNVPYLGIWLLTWKFRQYWLNRRKPAVWKDLVFLKLHDLSGNASSVRLPSQPNKFLVSYTMSRENVFFSLEMDG